jgi:hypothetical protein
MRAPADLAPLIVTLTGMNGTVWAAADIRDVMDEPAARSSRTGILTAFQNASKHRVPDFSLTTGKRR